MTRRILGILAALLLMAALLSPVYAWQPGDPRVIDRANLFTDAQKADLQQRLDKLIEKIGMDIVILTDTDTGGKSSLLYAADFYDDNGYGLGSDHTGVIYFIDMDNRVPTIVTTGGAIASINDDMIDKMLDDVWQDLSDGTYSDSVIVFLNDIQGYFVKQITVVEAVIVLLIAGLVMFVIIRTVRSKYDLKGETYTYDYDQYGKLTETVHTDTFINRTVTRRHIEKSSSSGGRSSGSSTFSGSSGTSHGGGSGRSF